MKAWDIYIPSITKDHATRYGDSRVGQIRYRVYLEVKDMWPETRLIDIKVRRKPEMDK